MRRSPRTRCSVASALVLSRPGQTLIAAIAAAALALGGCAAGGEDASSPLDEALGYLPEDAGFAFIASTDVGDYGEVEEVLDMFPFGGQVKELLKSRLGTGDFDFEDDLEPLLGNEVVIGTADNESFLAGDRHPPFVLALETEDEEKLADLVEGGGTESEGETAGHDVYRTSGDTWLAVKESVLVLSNDEETLERALAQRAEDDRLGEEDVEAAFDDLPEGTPVRVYANVKALVAAHPGAEEALEIKWVDHVETLGLTATVSDGTVALHYALATDPEGLGDDDLPLASGTDAPQVFERDGDSAEIVLGLRDPARVIEFAQAAGQAVDPGGFGQFEAAKKQIGKQLGVDVDEDVIAQLGGDVAAIATIDEQFGLRAELEDADEFEKTLAKVMEGLPQYAEGVTITKPREGDRFYGLSTRDGESYALGVVAGAFVLANDAELAADVATRELVDADGQEGAFVAVADAEQLANAALARFASGIEAIGGSLFTGPLGDVTSSASATTEGITGSLRLEIE